MDIVTKNLLNSFRKEETLPENIDISILFEHFANYCVISQVYGEEFSLDDVHTGGGDDLGLDGIAIVVNGTLVTDTSEIDDLAVANKFVDAEFIFIQAKAGSDFDGGEISNVYYGIKDFFSESPVLPRNDRVMEQENIKDSIYTKSSLFKKGNPRIHVYYVTTGKWQDDSKLLSRVKSEEEDLVDLTIFDKIEFHQVDARRLQSLYSKAKNRLTASISFSGKLTLPPLPGIQEAYLGYLPVTEYLKLIRDDSGNIARGLFYDNVRDFQGDNPVNVEIDETLKTTDRELFVLLNNGVTIVAESLAITGDSFTIADYQIVNGCQTSHVLFNNQEIISGKMQIPIKLIVSKDSDVKNKIIKATNRQTPVKPEELTALTDFQKSLEEYYSAIEGDCKLYYERRSQQYRAVRGIEKIRIVSISNQIRSFASMFLSLPHQASRYYGTLLKTIVGKIFVPSHPPVAYYVSALALHRFEYFARRNLIDAKYRPFKYHLIGLLRMQIAGVNIPSMMSNKFERYCDSIATIFVNEDLCLHAFLRAIDSLDKILGGDYARDKAKDVLMVSDAKELNRENLEVEDIRRKD